MRMTFTSALALAAVLAFAALTGCDTEGPWRTFDTPLVPDSTVFIVSTLEYSPDTTFWHPQVYVARLDDPLSAQYDLLADGEHKPNEELWHPLQWAQVGLQLYYLHLRPHPYNRAEVSITGPLGRPDERTVPFTFERRGVYGDLGRDLRILTGERYRLDVRLADGSAYTAETRVPAPAGWTVPDTLRMPVHYEYTYSQAPHHHERGGYNFIPWTPAPDADLTVSGVSHTLEKDYAIWGMQPGESLPFEDRNDYVRRGAQYYVFTNSPGQAFGVAWAEKLTSPPVSALDVFLRVYQLNPELALFYAPEDIEVTVASEDPWGIRNWNVSEIVEQRDTTYLPSISNIRRVGARNRPLPLAESDAVGIFGAYSARYAHSIALAVRNFDPDTLDFRP